jgi:hypothetical protein
MNGTQSNARCETCVHWQVFPQNSLAGHCTALGAMLWPKVDVDKGEEILRPATESAGAKLMAEISITTPSGFGQPAISEVIAVRTQKDFGCVHHEPK